jgi:hypothetical protein
MKLLFVMKGIEINFLALILLLPHSFLAEDTQNEDKATSSVVARKCDDVLGLQPEGKFVIRADISNAEEAVRWLQEYSVRTDTNWVTSKTYPNLRILKWRKDYNCHHTGFKTCSDNCYCQI